MNYSLNRVQEVLKMLQLKWGLAEMLSPCINQEVDIIYQEEGSDHEGNPWHKEYPIKMVLRGISETDDPLVFFLEGIVEGENVALASLFQRQNPGSNGIKRGFVKVLSCEGSRPLFQGGFPYDRKEPIEQKSMYRP